jgi:hypothetical protein
VRCAASLALRGGFALRGGHALRGALVAVLGLVGACQADDADDGASGQESGNSEGGETSGSGSGDTANGSGTADETGTGGSTGNALGPWSNLDERPCPDDSFLTYENFGGPFMLTYCTTCHASRLPADMRQGSPIEVNFDDIEDIRERADRIWFRAADGNQTMPPVGPPDEEARTRLGEWLACGAPTAADLGM